MSFFSHQYESIFNSAFDPDPIEKRIALFSSASEDPFSSVRQDFARIFHDNNIEFFTNATEFGLAEKMDSFSTRMDTPILRNGFPNPIFPYSPSRALQKELSLGNFLPGSNNGGISLTKMLPNFHEDHMVKREFLQVEDDIDTFSEDPLSNVWSSHPSKDLKEEQGHKYTFDMENLPGNVGIQDYAKTQAAQGQVYGDKYPIDLVSNVQYAQKLHTREDQSDSPNEDPKSVETRKVKLEALNKKDKGADKKDILALRRKLSKTPEDEDCDDDLGEKGRSLKGLRILSLKVKNIVIEKKKTTYKEVADLLVREVAGQSKTNSQLESKDEQNVKRRVYDALNVLIATGVLQKEGKMVTYSGNQVPASITSKPENRTVNHPIAMKTVDAKKRKEEKLELLNELLCKTLALKNLIKRNKEKDDSPVPGKKPNQSHNVQQANVSSQNNHPETIKFPFLVIDSPASQNNMNLNLDMTQKELLIESAHSLNIFGDVDILLKMKLHNVPRSFFEEQIPKGLRKFVPKSFMDSLE